MLYLVAYDITDDARRNRAADALLDFGPRVQESVFECLIENDERVQELLGRLREIAAAEDSIRVVPVCASCAAKLVIIGRGEPTRDRDVYVV